MRNALTIILWVLFLFNTPSINAQFFSFYLNGSIPQKQLASSGYHYGIGGSAEYLSSEVFFSNKIPFEIRIGGGAEYFYNGYSKVVKDVVFDTPNNDLGSVKFQNQMWGIYTGPKFIYSIGKFSPYVDIFGAYRVFSTIQENTFDNVVEGYEKQSSKIIFHNSRFHYGSSLGLLYNLNNSVAFDLRFSYSAGQNIDFADLKTPQKDTDFESNITYKVKNSQVSDIFIFRIGILFEINKKKFSREDYNPDTYDDSYNYDFSPEGNPAEVKPIPKPQTF